MIKLQNPNRKNKAIFIVGPTAVGKTTLAVKLARRVNGEIISCDSMQVYKGMPILSQAAGPSDRKKVKHHLVGVLSPQKEYNVAMFRKKAERLINSMIRRGKTPVVAGGSGLYVKALIDGLFPSPEADAAFRGRMKKIASRYGSKYLYKRLGRIDPQAAANIHPNDARRIIRALEIYHSTGKTMTDLKRKTRGLKDKYRIEMIGLTRPRDDIYSAINSRVERMFGQGAVEEVRALKKKRLSKTAGAALGFKEISGYLDGEYDLERAKELLKMNTRRFAKRQFTWFGADRRIRWFDVCKIKQDDIIRKIVCQLSGLPVGQFEPANRQTGKQVN
jgi:tRNA dimethylallyltransferase